MLLTFYRNFTSCLSHATFCGFQLFSLNFTSFVIKQVLIRFCLFQAWTLWQLFSSTGWRSGTLKTCSGVTLLTSNRNLFNWNRNKLQLRSRLHLNRQSLIRRENLRNRKITYTLFRQVSISSTLNVQIFRAKIRFGSFYYVHVTRKAAETKLSYKKFARLTLMKLTPAVNKNQTFEYRRLDDAHFLRY